MSWLADMATGATPQGPTRPPEGAEVPASPWGEFPPMMADPAKLEKDRLVSTKQANRPFLAYVSHPRALRLALIAWLLPDRYKHYREEREKEHQAWMERKKERDEKLARGEKVGPEERDPTEEQEVGCVGLLKFFTVVIVIVLLAGKFFADDYLWGYEAKWKTVKTWIPVRFLPSSMQSRVLKYWLCASVNVQTGDQLITERNLARHDGTDPNKPLWLAVRPYIIILPLPRLNIMCPD